MKTIWRKLSQKLQSPFSSNTFSNNKSSGIAFAKYAEANNFSGDEVLENLFRYSTAAIKNDPKEMVDFNELVATVRIKLRPLFAAFGANLIYSNLPAINIHRLSMEQVFEDLMAQAISGFTVDKDRSYQPCIKIEFERLNAILYQFKIMDNGTSTPTSELASAFHLFKKTSQKNKFQPTGLGLARAKRIINTYGGEIKIYTEEGIGNCFVFTVPLNETLGEQRPIKDEDELPASRKMHYNNRNTFRSNQ